jgi:hypothetical protein
MASSSLPLSLERRGETVEAPPREMAIVSNKSGTVRTEHYSGNIQVCPSVYRP